MKKLVWFLFPIVTGLFIVFNVSAQQETKANIKSNKSLRVIAKFDKKTVPGNILITKTEYIQSENNQSENIRNLFEQFNVIEIQAVFRNRYTNDGILKETIPNKSSIHFGGWQELILSDISRAPELVDFLNKEEGVIEAYIEKPVLLKPCIISAFHLILPTKLLKYV